MDQPLLFILLAAMLMLATPLAFNVSFVGAQENEDEDDNSDDGNLAENVSLNDTSLEVEQVVDGLDSPTAMAFLDEHRILVLEKNNGTVRLVEDGKLQSEPLLDVAVANDDERGLLGMAVSKENDTTTFVFLYYTDSGGGADGDDTRGVPPEGNKLYRYELRGDRLVNPKLLLNLPALPGPRYNGGPVAIGPDGNVYVLIGDAEGHTTQAQNFKDGPAVDGSSGILRVGKNGELPEPVIGTGEFGKYYFAYGIRNSFGMAFDPETGTLWDTENGPAFGDEINLVDAGFNSGWRKAQGDANQTDIQKLVLFNERTHYSAPEFSWTDTVGPTALAFLNSSALGQEYRGDMFVGDVNNGALYHFDLKDNRSALALDGALADTVADTPQESRAAVLGDGFGVITDIESSPGGLYVLSLTEGTIFRIFSTNAEVQEEQDTNSNDDGSEDNGTNDGGSTTSNDANDIPPADDGDGITELTVRSVDPSGNEITGMFTVIKQVDGTVLSEGYTPLTFAGDKGAIYVVKVADFGNRKFDHWENNSNNILKLVRLDGDATITAHYQIKPQASGSFVIERLAQMLDHGNCIDKQGERMLNKIIDDLFKGKEMNISRFERALDSLVDC